MKTHATPGDLFDDIDFRWLRPRKLDCAEGRFLNSKGKPSGESLEMVVASIGDIRGGEEYRPLEEVAVLSSDFGKLGSEKESFVDFASKWGFLETPDAARLNSQRGKKITVFGESISYWLQSIRDYHQAVDVLNWLRNGDERELKKRIVWDPKLDAWKYSASDGSNPLHFRLESPRHKGNVFVPSRRVFSAYANLHLRKHAHPSLLPISGNDGEGRFVLRIRPKNLIGLLWWQLGREALGDLNYRLCKVCKKPLEISKDDTGFRTNREFCSAICKQKDYREKVKTAKQLRDDGWTVQAIAKELGTTQEKIERWLTKKK